MSTRRDNLRGRLSQRVGGADQLAIGRRGHVARGGRDKQGDGTPGEIYYKRSERETRRVPSMRQQEEEKLVNRQRDPVMLR